MNILLREQYYKKLTRRNILYNLILFVSPFVVLLLVVNYEISRFTTSQIYSQLQDTVKENIKTVSYWLKDREIDLGAYSKLDVVELTEVSKLTPFIQSFISEKRWYDFIIIADPQGTIIFSSNTAGEANALAGVNIVNREYFKASIKGTFFNSGIFYSNIIHSPAIILSMPLLNKKNKIIGVVAVSLNLKKFYNLLFDLRIGKTIELILVDENGIILSPTRLGGKPLINKGYHESEKNPHTGEKGIKTHFDYRGQKVLCAYQKVPRTNFYMVSEIDLKEALIPVRHVSRLIYYVFIPFFILLVIISNLYSFRITAILKKLTLDLERALEETHQKKQEVDTINIELKHKVDETELLARELTLSEEYIRNIIDSISFGLISMDCNCIITHHNKGAADLFNINTSLIGKNVFEALPWLGTVETQTLCKNTFTQKQASTIEKHKLERGMGEEYFHLTFFPIENETGLIVGATLLIEDITERERLQEQLAKYEKLSSLSQLALGAAHEINNPLLG
ncbi:MAG: hypothetical protein A2Y62_01385, partial [Candidatus Fischerbacteria bacterium RBG_13_37_8]